MGAWLAMQMVGLNLSPNALMTSASQFQSLSDRDLQIIQAYSLSTLVGSGTAFLVATNGGGNFTSATNAFASVKPGNTLIFAPGQSFDLGVSTITISNINIIATGATLTISNFPGNIVFNITGPLRWDGGLIQDLGTATDASGIAFPFKLGKADSGVYNVNFNNLVVRSRSDVLSGPSSSQAGVPVMVVRGCDWEDLWDVLTLDGGGPSAGRSHYEFIGCRLAANATTHAGSFGSSATIAVIGKADAYFTGCTLVSSNATATQIGVEVDTGAKMYLAGNVIQVDGTAPDTEPIAGVDAGSVVIYGRTVPYNYIFSDNSTVQWVGGDITNFFATSAGTVYTMTGSYGLLAFGTTSPSITLQPGGGYMITGKANLVTRGATYGATNTYSIKLRRTSGTPADLAGSEAVQTINIITTTTEDLGFIETRPVIYNASTGDTIQLWGTLSATPTAGNVICDRADIIAIRLY